MDAPAMVRFGIKGAKDKKILNTIKVIDDMLLTQTRSGPVWHRYNHDGYGEHPDGSAFDGTGIGRGWPLLVGERGHYEIASGNFEEAQRLLSTMEKMTSTGGLIPEQIWDSDDIPKRGLFNGKPSGSAMPLVWAHAEYIKLCHSIMDAKVSDQLDFVYNRYVDSKVESHINYWNLRDQIRRVKKGEMIRIVLSEAAQIHYSFDKWVSVKDVENTQFHTGIFLSDFETANEKDSNSFTFTIFWENEKKWQGENFTIMLE
jgi:glucoamylase